MGLGRIAGSFGQLGGVDVDPDIVVYIGGGCIEADGLEILVGLSREHIRHPVA
nr:hypothetical protein [Methanocalculus sp.]